MTQVSAEPIQTPADNGIESPPLGVLHQRIEGGAALLRAAHPFIDVFPRDNPAASVRVSAQLQQLVLAGLINGAHPGVDRCLHRSSSVLWPARRMASAALKMRWHDRSGISSPRSQC